MKKYLSYILAGTILTSSMVAFTGCQDHFDAPDIKAPVASLQPNMTIFQLKKKYWNDATNYIDTIGIRRDTIYNADNTIKEIQYPRDAQGNRVYNDGQFVVHGRVVSSDEAGNMFKSLVIQDETAALAISINSYNLYLKYRMGQDLVIDLKGMYIGKYNGLVQLGMPEWYEAGNQWEASFMAPDFFDMHVQPNGFPEVDKIEVVEINSFSDIPTNPDGICRYQSQLVKFNNVYFQNGGVQQFSEYHSSGVNQNIVDVNGQTLPVRTSGYSNFWNKYLPAGNGDVECILSYYGTTGWQLILNDYEGCMNFGNPTVMPGAEDNPYTIMEAIDEVVNGKSRSGWVTGYIVGAVAPEVSEITSNADIEWSSDVVLNNTLVIGASADVKDLNQAMVISLPPNSALRQYGNLRDNPEVYKKQIWIKGRFGTYMGTYGILDNSGSASMFKIDGVEIVGPGVANGNGSESTPYNVSQVIAKNPQGNADAPDEKDVWVEGYIVGWADMSNTYYINGETARFTAPATANTNILLGPEPNCTDWSQCIGIQLPAGDVRNSLNLKDNPTNLNRRVKIFGNIAKYSGVPGMRSASKFEWVGGENTPVNPPAQQETSLYKEAFANTLGEFIINDVTIPDGLTYVWSATANYGAKASAFANSTSYATESWLISPVFDLKNASGVKMSFQTANNKYGSAAAVAEQSTVWVSVDGGKWQQLKGFNLGDNTSWTFVSSGDIDLSAYAGKKVSIGFCYTSTAESAGTWEIKDFELTGSGSVSTSKAIVPAR